MSNWLRLRRHLDRFAALAMAVLSLPIVAAMVILVRLEDGKRGLIRVERVGRGGAVFGMWKIRTMSVGADQPDGAAGGAGLTSPNDRRITSIGRKLRAYHLDELPQLWNVVAGQMILLGPRPEAPDFVDLGNPAWEEVLGIPPGIAGPTQLVVGQWEYRSISLGEAYYREVILPAKLAVDAWYLKRSSPVLDAFVLASLMGRFTGHAGVRLRRRVLADVPGVRVQMTLTHREFESSVGRPTSGT